VLQLQRAKRRRPPFPAAISPIPSLYGGRTGAGDGGGSANRRAGVHRLDTYRSRSRLCSPSVVDSGARVCQEGVPPWLAFPGGVGEAMAAAALGNKLSRTLPRPGGALLRRWRRGRRGLYRSAWQVARRQVSPLAFCLMDSRQAVDLVEDGWPDLARFTLGDAGRRRRARIWELEELGRGPSRWASA